MTSNSDPVRLADTDIKNGFPSHVAEILNAGQGIKFEEILCRLIHVCLIEVGFIPIIENEPDFTVEELLVTTFEDSVPKLIGRLRVILDKVGSLHNVVYKCLVLEEHANGITPNASNADNHNKFSTDIISNVGSSSSSHVAAKESGDGTVVVCPQNSEEQIEQNFDEEFFSQPSHAELLPQRKIYSSNISVSIIHEGFNMLVIANGHNFHQNMQICYLKYVRRMEQLPVTAKAEDYLRISQFEVTHFVDDVKRSFCFALMDDIDGLSFDIRSLSWFPEEIIVEIAKRCSPLSVFRLRATCSKFKETLSKTNVQFWKFMLKRDFPQYNIDHLSSNPNDDKYFTKYTEMCSFTLLRRPLRRIAGSARFFPLYLLSHFRI